MSAFLASLNDIIKTEYFMRKILIIAGILLCCLNMQAQDMKSLFVALPDSLSPLLTEVNRADFGDFVSRQFPVFFDVLTRREAGEKEGYPVLGATVFHHADFKVARVLLSIENAFSFLDDGFGAGFISAYSFDEVLGLLRENVFHIEPLSTGRQWSQAKARSTGMRTFQSLPKNRGLSKTSGSVSFVSPLVNWVAE